MFNLPPKPVIKNAYFVHTIMARVHTFLYDGRGVISPPCWYVLHDGVAEPDGSSAGSWGRPCEGEGTWVVNPHISWSWVVVSDTDVAWSAKAKLGEIVERSGIGKSANHIIGDLSTTLDQESSEGKSGTLGWTKGDCACERGGRERLQ